MEIKFDSFEPQYSIEVLSKKYRVKLQNKGAELFISLPKRSGEGIIKGIDFLDGIGFTRVNCAFYTDTVFMYEGRKNQPIRFIFCESGEIIHILNSDNFRYKLGPMVGSIAASANCNSQLIVFPPYKQISYFALDIDREKFLPKIEKELHTIPEKLANVFKDVENSGHFLYQSDYSLNISECLSEIENNPHEGMVRRIFLESKVLDLLWMQIKQYKDDQKSISKQSIIRKIDIKLILKAKNILIQDLKNPPSIEELAALTGTNATKLKKGFKRLYDMTINQYLRNKRLNYAKILLAEENLTIKEVAENVGYSNKSIFSKRFKEKFGVLPSVFLNRYKSGKS
ncbi:helix-turn-helix domain-containing protein [Maribellus comscasis]|uniref:Helix-turn-helix domain-containing protein n=1 Tax=Maribellus comscasis TaxID=2681766 RepID=A0A6I6K7V8_9BACT|nr:AraC family transcriptional regulator [Maribellus comscasis]QGY47683.1 helix-turn-helix domain-containing protein [Maribellus comscasis]